MEQILFTTTMLVAAAFLVLLTLKVREAAYWAIAFFLWSISYAPHFLIEDQVEKRVFALAFFVASIFFEMQGLQARVKRAQTLLSLRLIVLVIAMAIAINAIISIEPMWVAYSTILICRLFLTAVAVAVMLAHVRNRRDTFLIAATLIVTIIILGVVIPLILGSIGSKTLLFHHSVSLVLNIAGNVAALGFGFSALFVSAFDLIFDLREKALRDPLTKLLNRRGLEERIQHGYCSAPGAILLLDVDGFKSINDVHGHDVGDSVIVSIAHYLAQDIGNSGICVRLGGEEFLIWLPEYDRHRGFERAESLRQGLTSIDRSGMGLVSSVTASFGIAILDVRDSGFFDGVKRADMALHKSKKSGKNVVSFFPIAN